MDIEEEFTEFLISVPRRAGLPKLDGTPRKIPELDPSVQRRNREIILSFYGFGKRDILMPTYDTLGQLYGDLTRERIRQLIQRNYLDQIDGSLPVATEVGRIVAKRPFWDEKELLDHLVKRNLASQFSNSIGIVAYLKSQGLAEDYLVCNPDLSRVTRGNFYDHTERVVINCQKHEALKKDLALAMKVPGQVGLGNIKYVEHSGVSVDFETLKWLICANKNAWTARKDADFWYIFDNYGGNCLVNAAEKVFSIAERLPLDALSEMLHHSLYRRAAKTEFPTEELIRQWITQSRHFLVGDGLVQFRGEATPIVETEELLCQSMRGKGAVKTANVLDSLLAAGVTRATATKLVFNSPLLFIDRSQGRGNYLVTLATDLSLEINRRDEDRHSKFKERLDKINDTDRDAMVTVRREQAILAEWVFGRKKSGRCAICQKKFSRSALVVAHKKKRSICTKVERLDPFIVFPLCTFGCDFLYEKGHLKIRTGRVELGRKIRTKAERAFANKVVGNELRSRWLAGPPYYFSNG